MFGQHTERGGFNGLTEEKANFFPLNEKSSP